MSKQTAAPASGGAKPKPGDRVVVSYLANGPKIVSAEVTVVGLGDGRDVLQVESPTKPGITLSVERCEAPLDARGRTFPTWAPLPSEAASEDQDDSRGGS